MPRRVRSIFRFLFRRPQFEHELDAELRYHFDRQVELNLARGMSPAEARRQAAILVGGMEPLKEECRDARLGRIVETLWQDIRYGVRVLARNPRLTVATTLTLALGIGANTAIFSLVYGVLLRPLPYMRGSQLVVLHQSAPKAHITDAPFSVKEICDYRDRNHTLSGVVEHHTMNFLLIGKDTAERVDTAVVSANFFDVLGVKPILGRSFVATDDVVGGPAVLILTYKYWQTHQSGDPHIVGKVFQMNNRPHTVIGVLPPIPQYPSEADVYMPTSQCPTRSSARFIANRQSRMMTAFGRLKPGVTLTQAQSDLSVLGSNMVAANPKDYTPEEGYSIEATPLETDLTRRARGMFLVLLGVSGFVLLIACANVANLLLARLLKLERELAVRAALGAGKMRLLRQLLTESVLLSLGGGLLGLAMAPAALALLVKFAGRFTTRAAEVHIDAPVLLFTLLISIGTGIVFGLAPALSSGKWIGAGALQGCRNTASRGRQRMRGALVIAQVAVSVILLTGAGLMLRSFARLQSVNPGFFPDRLVTMRISPGFPRYTMQNLPLLTQHILAKMKPVPGVESVAMSSSFPFNPAGVVNGPGANQFEIQDRPLSKGEVKPAVAVEVVSADYFATIRQPVVKGRGLTGHDDEERAPLAGVVNQSMARHFWPNEDAIGKRLSFDNREHWMEIVGIAGDVKEYGLDRPAADKVYAAYQGGMSNRLVVRTAGDPQTVTPLLRAAMHEIDPLIAVDQVSTVERAEYDSLASPRVMTFLLGIFAGLAVLISAGGIAAVMALSVSQRTREIGVRMALGARHGAIVGMVVRNGLLLALTGAALGIVGATALTRLLASFLYATSPTDLATFVGVSLLFLAVAAAACFIPARQITSIDPLNALRQE
ncbi:MAG TPA: ABC transporter permease [Candidatus Sulfopaludibacter sp.]|nr:ABC transporter permease [Candidatus Sulfopaludibacter sp.]